MTALAEARGRRIRVVDRREALIDAVFVCVVRDGLGATTTAAVAEEAGVSKGVIHYYFRDKIALLEAAFERVLEGFHEALARQPSGTGRLTDELDSLVRIGLPLNTSTRERTVFWTQFLAPGLNDPTLGALQQRYYARWRQHLGDRIAALQVAGKLRATVDPHALATAIIAFSDGLGIAMLGGLPGDDAAGASAVELFVDSIAAANAEVRE